MLRRAPSQDLPCRDAKVEGLASSTSSREVTLVLSGPIVLDWCRAEIGPGDEAAIADLAALDALCNSHPWSREDFLQSLRDGHLCLVARADDGHLIGFAVARALPDEAELLLIGIHPEHRREGVGRSLLTALERRLAALGARCMHLEVRALNVGAQRFYESLGYRRSGLRRAYYPAGRHASEREDAVLMTHAWSEATVPTQPTTGGV